MEKVEEKLEKNKKDIRKLLEQNMIKNNRRLFEENKESIEKKLQQHNEKIKKKIVDLNQKLQEPMESPSRSCETL